MGVTIEFSAPGSMSAEKASCVHGTTYVNSIVRALQVRGYAARKQPQTPWDPWTDPGRSVEGVGGVFCNLGNGIEVVALCSSVEIAQQVVDALKLSFPHWRAEAKLIEPPS